MLEKIEILKSKTKEYSVVIIWLHGLGAPANDFCFLADEMALPENLGIKYIFPQAPSLSVSLNNRMVMPAWYDIIGLNDVSPQDIDGALRSLKEIDDIVLSEQQTIMENRKIFVGGFSQGGAMALLAGVRTKGLLSGVICCSGYLLRDAVSKPVSFHKQSKNCPIFIGHGNEDDVVLKNWGAQAFKDLLEQGFLAEWKCYQKLGHSINYQEVKDISNFILSKI